MRTRCCGRLTVSGRAWRDLSDIESGRFPGFLDRWAYDGVARHHARCGWTGLTSVMLGHAAWADARCTRHGQKCMVCCRRIFAGGASKVSGLPTKKHHARGRLPPSSGSVTPIDDIGKMVNIGTLLASSLVASPYDPAPNESRSGAPFRTPWVPVVPILGILFNGT